MSPSSSAGRFFSGLTASVSGLTASGFTGRFSGLTPLSGGTGGPFFAAGAGAGRGAAGAGGASSSDSRSMTSATRRALAGFSSSSESARSMTTGFPGAASTSTTPGSGLRCADSGMGVAHCVQQATWTEFITWYVMSSDFQPHS